MAFSRTSTRRQRLVADSGCSPSASDLFARSNGSTWPNDLTGRLTVAVTALLVAVGAAVALRIVVAISNRKSANPSE
ncbi:hypothetical protein IU418_19825 [Nocardia farcinica]|uniref:hypothetical protein n=1 Tax=Nocardia farcinica TaxID=37329 RepID=UPI001B3C8AAB|nr:hypothetical protein [Nocardia farcinica]MBF6539462.1 hypothetical protein [Nocardia farcinica]